MAKKNQVARNERERNRVHQVNHGFDVLRNRLQPKNHTKKWSKADTLREAVKYIQQLQLLLNQDPQQPSVSSATPEYSMNNNSYNNHYGVKEEFSVYLPPAYHQGAPNQMAMPHGGASQNFNSPTSSVSSSSYSPTEMGYPPVPSYSNYPPQRH